MKNVNNKTIGMILSGGEGTRLYPLTKDTPKPLLPVGGQTMISYVFEYMVNAGIKDILILIKEKHEDIFKKQLTNYKQHGVENLDYIFDAPGTVGLVNAIYQARGYVNEDQNIVVACGDVLIEKGISKAVRKFIKQEEGARLLGLKTKDTAGFSPIIMDDDLVKEILQKDKDRHVPGVIDSGTYMYKNDVFEKIEELKNFKQNPQTWELNDIYIKQKNLYCTVVDGWWSDVGNSLETYYKVNERYDKKYKN